VQRNGQSVILVSADGSLSVPATSPDPIGALVLEPTKRSGQSSAATGWAADHVQAAIGPPEVLHVAAPPAQKASTGSTRPPLEQVHVPGDPSLLTDKVQLPGQLLPAISTAPPSVANAAPDPGRPTATREGGACSSDFASVGSESPGLLRTSLTEQAVPLGHPEDSVGDQVREVSDFASVGSLPASSGAAAAPGKGQTRAQKVVTSAGHSVSRPSTPISPLTADGQWPTAFVGGQSLRPSVEPPAPPVQGPATTTSASPSQALTRLEEQVTALCGPAVRKVQFRQQQDQSVVMVLTLADASVQSTVTSKLEQIPGFATSGMLIELKVGP
jgi:hypothetical protein